MDEIKSGFWFLPSAMLVVSGGLALLLLFVDRRVDPGIKSSIQWAYSGGPEGARSLLSTIAGSMITAASVTFSLASVALSIASQQYGSRVLRNYMRDRITQVLLGTFISTFIYAVLVVRDIRGSDFAGGFVPAISVTAAIALSLVSLVLLIFFVHHISTSIKASHQLLVIANDIRDATKRLYPEWVDEPGRGPLSQHPGAASSDLTRGESGYLQSVDLDTLLSVARRRQFLIEVIVKPGDHHIGGAAVARVFGGREIPEEDQASMRDAFLLGGERTPAQDIRYQFQQLAEIIIRALSPAINDPFTAMNGIDQLGAGLCQFARQPRAVKQKRDADGTPLLIVQVPEISELLENTVGHIALYARADRFVMARLERVLEVLEPDLRYGAERSTAARLRLEIQRSVRAASKPGTSGEGYDTNAELEGQNAELEAGG